MGSLMLNNIIFQHSVQKLLDFFSTVGWKSSNYLLNGRVIATV